MFFPLPGTPGGAHASTSRVIYVAPARNYAKLRKNPQKPRKRGFTGLLHAARKIAGAIYIIGGAPPKQGGTPPKTPFLGEKRGFS